MLQCVYCTKWNTTNSVGAHINHIRKWLVSNYTRPRLLVTSQYLLVVTVERPVRDGRLQDGAPDEGLPGAPVPHQHLRTLSVSQQSAGAGREWQNGNWQWQSSFREWLRLTWPASQPPAPAPCTPTRAPSTQPSSDTSSLQWRQRVIVRRAGVETRGAGSPEAGVEGVEAGGGGGRVHHRHHHVPAAGQVAAPAHAELAGRGLRAAVQMVSTKHSSCSVLFQVCIISNCLMLDE